MVACQIYSALQSDLVIVFLIDFIAVIIPLFSLATNTGNAPNVSATSFPASLKYRLRPTYSTATNLASTSLLKWELAVWGVISAALASLVAVQA